MNILQFRHLLQHGQRSPVVRVWGFLRWTGRYGGRSDGGFDSMRLPALIPVDREAEQSMLAFTSEAIDIGEHLLWKGKHNPGVGKRERGTFGLRLVQCFFEFRAFLRVTQQAVCFSYSAFCVLLATSSLSLSNQGSRQRICPHRTPGTALVP